MIFTASALSNEDYHSDKYPQASGSILWAMHSDCPAAYKFSERKETKALRDGTAIHCAMLEPERFNSEYVRGIDSTEKEYLITNADMKSWLQNAGIKVSSTADKTALIDMLKNALCDLPVLAVEQEQLETLSFDTSRGILPAKTFDLIIKMQEGLTKSGYSINEYNLFEVSCINTDENLKCRFDIVIQKGGIAPDGNKPKNGEVWDYKTTITASPELFASSALKYGYWCKMALQADLYKKQFGVKPDRVVLLAQSKTAPYIAQAYELTEQQLEIGRQQYQAAKQLLDHCTNLNEWPTYGGGVQTLQTPAWAANMYDFEDTIEIIEGQ